MLAAKYTNKKVCFFHLTPLFTKTGWYFKARTQRHSRGPFPLLRDAENAARQLFSKHTHQ